MLPPIAAAVAFSENAPYRMDSNEIAILVWVSFPGKLNRFVPRSGIDCGMAEFPGEVLYRDVIGLYLLVYRECMDSQVGDHTAIL